MGLSISHFSRNSQMCPQQKPLAGCARDPCLDQCFLLGTATRICALQCPCLHSPRFQKTPFSGKMMRGDKTSPVGWRAKKGEGRESVSRRRREREESRVNGSERVRKPELSYMGMSMWFRSPFFSTTRFLPMLAARFRIHRSSDFPTTLQDWIMTY